MMRSLWVGFFLLITASGAFGQATGFVKGLGFQGDYRPDCWTALLVHLDSTISDPAEYQIQVHQQDMDKDTVVYARTVTLGPQAREDFWVYFLPQPTGRSGDGGSLPSRPADVNEVLQVHLYDKTGRTEIARLKAEVAANNVDPAFQTGLNRPRGTRVILCVRDTDQPSWSEYQRSVGVAEQIQFVSVKPYDLPGSVLAYQGIDGIIWFDANAMEISTGGSKAFDAVQQYVRRGGVLVVCQPDLNFVRISPFANAGMLPVVAKDAKGEWAIETQGKPDLEPLISLATPRETLPGIPLPWKKLQESRDKWDFARARATPDAVVDVWMDWDAKNPGADTSPYIARKAYGMGSVVWVAHDLGNPALMRVPGNDPASMRIPATSGWPHVWDKVFAWKNQTYTEGDLARMDQIKKEETQLKYGDSAVVDLSASLRQGLEHSATAATYIFIAILFFIGYWVIAGPGSYLFLAARKRRGLSWTVFGVVAVAAAGFTVLVVKLVLRGSPTAHHVTIVKLVPADPTSDGSPQFNAVIHSWFGLYIPRDGEQAVTVGDLVPGQTAYVSPYPIHPSQMKDDTGFTDRAKYVVSMDEPAPSEDKAHLNPVRVDVPYRSTLKKLQAEWSGTVSEGITGSGKLLEPGTTQQQRPDPDNPKQKIDIGTIAGTVTNKTGHDLQGVYFAFKYTQNDWLWYLSSWPRDTKIDLELELDRAARLEIGNTPSDLRGIKSVKGLLFSQSWGRFWHDNLPSGMMGSEPDLDDHDRNFAQSLPLMAFYSRLEPQAGEKTSNFQRQDLIRRGGRDLDVSHLVASGKLVIVARATGAGPPPMPLAVEGEKPQGEGVVFYETALPLDRSAIDQPPAKPASLPAASPATQPATRPVLPPAPKVKG